MLLAEKPRSKETIARILAAAEDLFLERNYADVTVSQVAAAAELTKGAVYHHFSSKEALYLAMLHNDLAEKRRLYRREAVEFTGPCSSRLRQLTQAFLSLPERKRGLTSLVRRDINVFPNPIRSELIRAYQEALPDLVEEIVRDGIRDGELIPCDPRLLAWQFVALVEVLLTPYALQRFACDEDRLNYVVSLFLDGCSREHKRDER
jgi:AcrR family transcriptional regulator